MKLPTMSDYQTYEYMWEMVIVFCGLIGLYLALGFWYTRQEGQPIKPQASDKVWWAKVMGFALLLRVPLLFSPMWYDETFTRAMVLTRWQDFPVALLSDVHPPGYYLIERAMVMILGASPLSLRLPALVCGLLLIWLVYRFTHQVSRRQDMARLAAWLTVILPMGIYYSTEARYPMMLATVVLGAALALLEDRPRLFIFLAMMPTYLHSVGTLYTGALLISAVLYWQSWRWLGWSVLSGVLSALWLPGLLLQSADVSDGFWLALRTPFSHVMEMTAGQTSPHFILLTMGWGLVVAVSLLGLAAAVEDWNRRTLLIWLGLVLGVPGIAWGISALWHPIYHARVMLGSVILLIPGWAAYLTRYKARFLRGVTIVSLVSFLPILYLLPRTPEDKPFADCAGSDLIYTTTNVMGVLALTHGGGLPVAMWHESDNFHQVLSDDAKEALGITLIDDPQALRGKVCMVVILNYLTRQEEIDQIQAVLDTHHPSVHWTKAHRLFNYITLVYEV